MVYDKDLKPVGTIDFRLTVMGTASAGARQVRYTVIVEDIKTSTLFGTIDWLQQRIAFTWRGCSGTPQITCPNTDRDSTIASWTLDNDYSFVLSTPDNTGAGPDYRIGASLVMDVTLGSAPAHPATRYDLFATDMRFDSGRRMNPSHGAVFPDYIPTLALSLSDTTVDESARHIYDAWNHPERTFPSWLGKSVPGKDKPLHRLVDSTLIDTNRSASINVCKDVWGDYSETQLQCDEFPFASTWEGSVTWRDYSNSSLDCFSARLIDGGDNGTAGARLGEMYRANRVLDNDGFQVRINP